MDVIRKYPIILKERLELGPEEQRFPGTLADFAALGEECEYQIEYEDGEIIAMSIASDPHEQIVANVLGVFFVLFGEDEEMNRYGSNRHVFIPEFKSAYSPDASIVKGEPHIFEYAPGKTANLNPFLVVEIISLSSRERDFGKKLPRYKEMESLEYILLIEQDRPLVTVFQRIEGTRRWQSTDYDQLDQFFIVQGKEVSMTNLYKNVTKQFSG